MKWLIILFTFTACSGSVDCELDSGTKDAAPVDSGHVDTVQNACTWRYNLKGELVDCPDCGRGYDFDGNLILCSIDFGGPGVQ